MTPNGRPSPSIPPQPPQDNDHVAPGCTLFDTAEVIHYAETDDRYATLRSILNEAYDYAAYGKGEQRHGSGGLSWTEQRHVKIAEAVGQGFAVGQAMKKLEEGYNMEDWQACRREFLGAITYISSAIFAGDQGID